RSMGDPRRESSPAAVVLFEDLSTRVFQKEIRGKRLAYVFDLIGFSLLHREGEDLERPPVLVAFLRGFVECAEVVGLAAGELQVVDLFYLPQDLVRRNEAVAIEV